MRESIVPKDSSGNPYDRRRFLGNVFAATSLSSIAANRAAADTVSGPNLNGLVSVKDFGADHTGFKDSTDAIQSAIDNAYPVANGEAAVFFPSGKYRISDTLVVSNRNNLSLIGMRASIVQTANNKDIIKFQKTNHCAIRDIYLSSSERSGNGITLDHAIRTILDNVEVYQVGGHCLWADTSFWLSARDCVFSKPGRGKFAVYHAATMNSVAYQHCFIGNGNTAGGGGLLHADGTSLALIACDLSNNNVGLLLRQGTSILVSNCYFEHDVVGMQWGDDASNTWPMGGSIESCYFTNTDPNHQPVFVDIQRGTNFRMTGPVMTGNDINTIGIRVNNNCKPAENRHIVIDDLPYMQFVKTRIDDPGRRLRRIATEIYCDTAPPNQC